MLRLVPFLLLFSGACTGFQWTDTIGDGPQLEVCSGDPVKLYWYFNLTQGERLKVIEWKHQARGKHGHLVASYEEENFVPTADFSGRVSHGGTGAIELSCATVLDTGRHTVVVTTVDAAQSLSVHRRSVAVMINDSPKTKSGGLETRQEQKAFHDATTKEWHVRLSCGHFSDRGHPPLDVVWKTPDDGQLSSSDFSDGHFHLLVPNPVKGGNYSCGLPSNTPANKCLPQRSALYTDVTVYVDEVSARFALQEAQLQALKMQVENESQLLQAHLDVARLQVGFHASLGKETTLSDGDHLRSFSVVSNDGQAFNRLSGEFTAPVNGTYFFVGSTGTHTSSHHANMALMKDGIKVSETYLMQVGRNYDSSTVMGSCHAVLHLKNGQKVWLECTYDSTFWRGTVFSGFLISADN
ncbi:uncharacterized protein [Littorina saxatilis]|uniref:C1q domain-containing protein n=1 Tax=Littorina saxatilis TaxID=31220 RepID=A0AAN9BTF0_9CAEN